MASVKNIDTGKLGDLPNEKYLKFFSKFEEIETIDVINWKPLHLVAYFAKKYKEQYNTSYKFKFNTPSPSNCFEVFHVKRLALHLSSKPEIIKQYIDWVFDTKVIKAKRRITSISFISNEGVLEEYKRLLYSAPTCTTQVINRTAPLSKDIISVFSTSGYDVSTYGDLAFLYKIQDQSISNLFKEAAKFGLDVISLENVL